MNGFTFRTLGQVLSLLTVAQRSRTSIRVEDHDGLPLDGFIEEVSPTKVTLRLVPVVPNLAPSLFQAHKLRWVMNNITFIASCQLLECADADAPERTCCFSFPISLSSKDAREYARFVLPNDLQLPCELIFSEDDRSMATLLDVSPCGFRLGFDGALPARLVAGTAAVFQLPSEPELKPLAAISMWTRKDSAGFLLPDLRGVDTAQSEHPWLGYVNKLLLTATGSELVEIIQS